MDTRNELWPRRDVALGIMLLVPTLEVILVRNNASEEPRIRIPGGKVPKVTEQTVEEVLFRKTQKQTGIDLSLNKVDFLFQFLPRTKKRYHVYSCIITDTTGLHEEPIRDGSNTLEVMRVDPSKVGELVMTNCHQKIFQLGIEEMYKLL